MATFCLAFCLAFRLAFWLAFWLAREEDVASGSPGL